MKFDATQLEMLVLPRSGVEALLYGEPDALRVYLYGLLNGSATPEQLARELSIPQSEVVRAVEVLQNTGLLQTAGDTLVYTLPRPEQAAAGQEVYGDAGFNRALQTLFSDRELHYQDYKLFYELMDVYALPRQVLLMLAEYCIGSSSAGNKVSMAYLRKVGVSWAKDGIDSIAAAEQKIAAVQRSSGQLRELLSGLNILRAPTAQEAQLYEKWTEEWGFSYQAVREATAATTGAQYPTLKYLDGVLKSLAKQGHKSAEAVRSYFALQEQLDDRVKEVLRALSYARLTVSPDQRTRYLEFTELGFGHSEILLACAQAAGRSAGLDYVTRVLQDWHGRGLKTEAAIRAHLAAQQALGQKARAMLEAAGYKRRITAGDLTLYEKFSGEYGFAHEVILFAAACALGSNSPLRAMDTMLQRWKSAGVHNLQDARQANAAFQGRGRKPAQLSDIEAHTYAEGQLSALIPDPTLEFRSEED